MTGEPQTEAHPVYPAGPLCSPNCPGEWSMYHDGYADGYENAITTHSAALREAVEGLEVIPLSLAALSTADRLAIAGITEERLARALFAQEPHTCDDRFAACARAILAALSETP